MKKLIIGVMVLFAIFFSVEASYSEGKPEPKIFDVEYETKDRFILKSKLTYPSENKSMYPMVVLLHSLGYSSTDWVKIKPDFLAAGVAVLEVDLKGHGKSSTDTQFKRRSWIYFDDKAFQLYPEEVYETVKMVLAEHKNISPSYIAYIGADIGANTAIGVARMQTPSPVAMVLISPHLKFKGLYSPIKLANAGNVPIFAVAAKQDLVSVKQLDDLKKYAQGSYETKIYPNGGTGMLMLKVNKDMHLDIVNWVVNKINDKI